MRITIPVGGAATFNWDALRGEEHFLYRRVADVDRAVLAVGVAEEVDAPRFGADGHADDWYFAALNYEWRSVLVDAPDAPSEQRWFRPRLVVEWVEGRILAHVLQDDLERAGSWVSHAFSSVAGAPRPSEPIVWAPVCSKELYLANVQRLIEHIQQGDIYEVNYCTERTASVAHFDPFTAFRNLNDRSQAPFAAFYRNGSRYALCASPERFLAFDRRRVIGQPMKGTRKRHSDADEDARLAKQLAADPKERSENVMALDVMRHDLSRIAASGTVMVPELCVVRTYPHVHQMVSTVAAVIREGATPLDVLRVAFPMASMTGAPKLRATQLIAEVEDAPRGLFSGSLGFFAPDGTGDFNVVIRTVMYDAQQGVLSLKTGSAITARCSAEDEYAECELKARSVMDAME